MSSPLGCVLHHQLAEIKLRGGIQCRDLFAARRNCASLVPNPQIACTKKRNYLPPVIASRRRRRSNPLACWEIASLRSQ